MDGPLVEEDHNLRDDDGDGHIPGDISADLDTLPPPCSCCGKLLGSCHWFIQSQVELANQVFQTGTTNQDGVRIPLQQPSLRPQVWSKYLDTYWDRDPIMEGLLYGWDIGIVGSPKPISAPRNHPSAMAYLDDVHHYIQTELAHGCIFGPLSRRDLPFPVSLCTRNAFSFYVWFIAEKWSWFENVNKIGSETLSRVGDYFK